MKIIHITEDFSMANFGVTTALKELISHTNDKSVSMEVLAIGKDSFAVPENVKINLCPESNWCRMWRYSPVFTPLLKKLATEDTVFHIHGVWMAPQWSTARISRRMGIPSVLTPHAMLDSWFWNEQGWSKKVKKHIYWNTMAWPEYRHLTVIQALTPRERDSLALLFPGQRIEVIPNAIDLPEVDKQIQQTCGGYEPFILFFGRLHPQKGVDLLLKAFSKAQLAKEWRLVIAGPIGSGRYVRLLKEIVLQEGIEKQVEFVGPIYGVEKWKWMKRAWVLCAPSNVEGMSMVALESMACSTPIITTHNAGFSDLPVEGGILVRPELDDLKKALIEVVAWSNEERYARGMGIRKYLERRYGWDVVAPQYLELYRCLMTDL